MNRPCPSAVTPVLVLWRITHTLLTAQSNSGLGTVPCGITLSTDAAAHARDGRHGAGGGYWAGVGVFACFGLLWVPVSFRVVRVSPPWRLTRSGIPAGGRVGEVRAKLKA